MSPRQDYCTPPWLFSVLNKDWGPFTLDPWASDDNHLCESYITAVDDGFTTEWPMDASPFGNPPFARSKEAVEKAHYHSNVSNRTSCLLLQAGISTRWFHTYATTGRVLIPNCRINYYIPGVKLTSFNRDSLIVLFGPEHWGAGIHPYYVRDYREKFEKKNGEASRDSGSDRSTGVGQ